MGEREREREKWRTGTAQKPQEPQLIKERERGEEGESGLPELL